MRNLKKFLALVLAVMMAASLMVTANAAIDTNAAVTDKDSVTEEFKEAVAVLNGLGIITGYEDKTFRPGNPITRQETTALVYRLHSGDVKDTKNDLYSTADNIKQFTDVNREGGQKWSAGYIGYCANQGIIKGVSNTRFAPTSKVTGYQVLAMVLRAIGYGQNGEYEGTGWQTRVATTATKLGLLKNINNTNYGGTLSDAATRELVAEIIFQAALQPTVTYTLGFGYVPDDSSTAGGTHGSLSKKNFNLRPDKFEVIDKWGRPGYKWYSGSTAIATIKIKAVKDYDTTQRECDVAHDLGIDDNATYRLYVNNNEPITDNYLIEATDTVTKVGGQGRIIEFYDELVHPYSVGKNWPASVVMIDTFLAKVIKVENEVLDSKNHQMIPAKLTLMVYDGYSETEDGTNTKGGSFPGGHTRVVTKSSGNWEFVKGDFVTLNTYTDNTNGIDANDKHSVHTGATGSNRAAFEAEQTKVKSKGLANELDYAENITKVEPVLGKQTTIYWNQGKHQVDGQDKDDQLDLHLDVAGTTTDTTFAWYYDTKGNLIGIGNVPDTINYGIITSIYSSFKQGDGATTGEAVAIATVKYADGTEGTVTIDRFLVNSTTGGSWGHNGPAAMVDQITTGSPVANNAAGATELLPVYDYGTNHGPMTAEGRTVNSVSNAVQAGVLYVAPVAGINANEEAEKTTLTTPWGDSDSYGILKGNLFKFIGSADGNVTAVEVAGTQLTGVGISDNSGIYLNHFNQMTTAQRELSKNYAYLNVGNRTIRMDNDTKIMVRGCEADNSNAFKKATDSIAVYNGIDELPANIVVPNNTEVDWADIDGDDIADVVYVYGVSKGATTYGLFYYNGGAGQWTGNAETGSGYLHGWLNATETDLYFDNKVEFDLVQQSTILYGGHLFAVRMFDGVVDNLMGRNSCNNNKDWILSDGAAAGTANPNTTAVYVSNIRLNTGIVAGVLTLSGTADFGVGLTNAVDNGNDYTADTRAIWLHDDGASQKADNTYTDVRWNKNNNSIEVATYTVTNGVSDLTESSYSAVYRLTGSSAILGDMLDYVNILDRVNDITIVFENGTHNAIRQIYNTTRDDITAPGEGNVDSYYSSKGTRPANGGNVRWAGESFAELEAAVKNGARNSVIFGGPHNVMLSSSTLTSYTELNRVLGSGLPAAPGPGNQWPITDYLFFPFTVDTAAPSEERVVLEIKDSNLITKYTEQTSKSNTQGWFFAVNFAGTADNAAGSPATRLTLSPGTYTFTITSTTSGVISSGSFTITR